MKEQVKNNVAVKHGEEKDSGVFKGGSPADVGAGFRYDDMKWVIRGEDGRLPNRINWISFERVNPAMIAPLKRIAFKRLMSKHKLSSVASLVRNLRMQTNYLIGRHGRFDAITTEDIINHMLEEDISIHESFRNLRRLILLLKSMQEDGIDIGVVNINVLEEKAKTLMKMIELGAGHCSITSDFQIISECYSSLKQ